MAFILVGCSDTSQSEKSTDQRKKSQGSYHELLEKDHIQFIRDEIVGYTPVILHRLRDGDPVYRYEVLKVLVNEKKELLVNDELVVLEDLSKYLEQFYLRHMKLSPALTEKFSNDQGYLEFQRAPFYQSQTKQEIEVKIERIKEEEPVHSVKENMIAKERNKLRCLEALDVPEQNFLSPKAVILLNKTGDAPASVLDEVEEKIALTIYRMRNELSTELFGEDYHYWCGQYYLREHGEGEKNAQMVCLEALLPAVVLNMDKLDENERLFMNPPTPPQPPVVEIPLPPTEEIVKKENVEL